jgi:hypothetical protein
MREYGRRLAEALESDPYVLAPLKLHYLRWVLFDNDTLFMYQEYSILISTNIPKTQSFSSARPGSIRRSRTSRVSTVGSAHAQPRRRGGRARAAGAGAHALEAAGRHKKRVGAILIASGSAILAAGTGLLIAGSWGDDCRAFGNGSRYDANDGYHDHRGGCYDRSLSLAGATTSALGVGVLVPGIIIYVSGGKEVDTARRLRWRW